MPALQEHTIILYKVFRNCCSTVQCNPEILRDILMEFLEGVGRVPKNSRLPGGFFGNPDHNPCPGFLVRTTILSRYMHSTECRYCDKEIRSRIGLAKVKFMERKKILTSKMYLDLRKRIV